MASIKTVGKNKYRVIISEKFLPNGKRNRITRTIEAKTPKELEIKLKLLEKECKDILRERANNVTFEHVVEEWKTRRGAEHARKTKERYYEILRNSLLPYFGSKKIEKINEKIIDDYIFSLGQDGVRKDGKKGGYSQQTKKHYYRLLHTILEYSIRRRYLLVNPCTGISTPKVIKKKKAFYTEEVIRSIVEKLNNEHLVCQMYVYIALETGCRRAEVMGLEWKDIDFDDNVIKLCRTSNISETGEIYEGPLKNKDGYRMITFSNRLNELLQAFKIKQDEYKEECKDTWVENDRLFVDAKGMPANPTIPTKWFGKFQERYGLEKITFHDLRHIHISILIKYGIDIETIRQRVGHSSANVTLEVYAHLFGERDYKSPEIIEEQIHGKSAS
jgi:integrase